MRAGHEVERRFARWLGPALEVGRAGPAVLRALLALIDDGADGVGAAGRAIIRFDPDTGSARLGWDDARGRFVVAVGPGLFEGTVRGPTDLLYIIAHELLHLVRGEHWRPPGRDGLAYNLAADALNDAWLTGPALAGMFPPLEAPPSRRAPTSPELALLVPLEVAARAVDLPADAPAAQVSRRFFERVVTPPSSPGPARYVAAAWGQAHCALQLGGRDDSLGLEAAVAIVRPLLDQLPIDPARVGLSLPAAARRALAALRHELAARVEALGGDGVGAGAGGAGVPELMPVRPGGRVLRRLERFLRGLVDTTCEAAPSWAARGFEPRPSEVGGRVGRRSVVEYRAGVRATPWSEGVARGGEGPFGLRVYLDVSASMWDELPPILATLGAACADILALPMVAFSVGARPVTLRELGQGRLPTDGGTDFRALAEDLLARRVQRAVVVSDGVAPPLPEEVVRALRARGVRVALVFPGRCAPSPLDAVCPRGWRLGLGNGGGAGGVA